MKRPFRIKDSDTIRANALNKEGKVIASLYDSGFTTKKQVESALLRKIPHFSGRELEIGIFNIDKDAYKRYKIKVN
jgi:hypothetical protein